MLALAATMMASALFAAPSTVGPVGQTGEPALVEQADLVEGAWLQFHGPAGERLLRVDEGGRVTPIGLPPQLRGEPLKISPLQDGWTVAVDRNTPAAREKSYCCREIEEPEPDDPNCCAEWVVGVHDPGGRWKTVQTLPHSRGTRTWVSEPVESHGQIEIAWGEQFSETVWVAEAPLGRPFGPPHRAGRVQPEPTDAVNAYAEFGHLWIDGEYGPHLSEARPSYIIERRLFGNGRLGPPRLLRSPLLEERGTFFDGPGGSELYVYVLGANRVVVARRAPGASSFEHPRVVLRHGNAEMQSTQSLDDRTLLSMETEPSRPGTERILAVGISPGGRPGPARTVESEPDPSTRYWEGAIDDAGKRLIASSRWNGGPLWLHPYSPLCAYLQRKIPLGASTTGSGDPKPRVTAGPAGAFHVAWIDRQDPVQTTTVRVSCGVE